ncbi:MAG: hypothetical protein WDZ29_00750 [Balneolaceae bacterium]
MIQEQQQAYVDTLAQSFGENWQGAGSMEGSSAFVQMMSSNELLPVVLGVSLIIWFVLLFFLVRVDLRIKALENELDESEKDTLTKDSSETAEP